MEITKARGGGGGGARCKNFSVDEFCFLVQFARMDFVFFFFLSFDVEPLHDFFFDRTSIMLKASKASHSLTAVLLKVTVSWSLDFHQFLTCLILLMFKNKDC